MEGEVVGLRPIEFMSDVPIKKKKDGWKVGGMKRRGEEGERVGK
jgi:hypothetical protein